MLNFREIEKISSERADNRIYCKCGHSMNIPKSRDKQLCSFCGNYVYRTKKLEFKDRLKQNIIKERRINKNG